MGVDFYKCSICGDIRISGNIFCLAEKLHELEEAIENPKVIQYLFNQDEKNLNKNEVIALIKKFDNCDHLFCDDCVDNDGFYKIECFEEKTKYDDNDYLLCCYNFILALQKLVCEECDKVTKEDKFLIELKVIKRKLICLSKSTSLKKKEIFESIARIIKQFDDFGIN
jgi:hypothetical protein